MTLESLVEGIKFALTKAGITDEDVTCVFHEKVDAEKVTAAVRDVAEKEAAHWLHVRAKVTETMWDYYEASGNVSLIECQQLRKASHELRTAWRRRVIPFYKEAIRVTPKTKRKGATQGTE